MKIIFDASPMLVNKTGVAYYTEGLVTEMAKEYPNNVELVGFLYNFLGRRNTSILPRAKNLNYTNASIIPSKLIYQLRRMGIEIPIETLARQSGDFILYDNFLSQPSLHNTPSAPVIHDLTYLDLPDYVSAKLRRDLEKFVPVAIKRSSFVVTVSEFCKQRINEAFKVPLDKIVVTPIPPAQTIMFDKQTRSNMLNELGINKSFLLFLGTVEPRKNIPRLIDAYLQLPDSLRNKYHLVIAGMMGWNCEAEESKLRESADKGVLHLGYVSEEQRALLYQTATLFVHASHYEGFGMPVLEAMSYGLPCAVSDIPIFRETASDNVKYFNQDDPKSISKTVQELLNDGQLLNSTGRAGLQHARSYSWETVSRRLYGAIEKAVGGD